jgi:hypothetical protein
MKLFLHIFLRQISLGTNLKRLKMETKTENIQSNTFYIIRVPFTDVPIKHQFIYNSHLYN